jgi:glycosyltransferase involved in cell wall biosynthesis
MLKVLHIEDLEYGGIFTLTAELSSYQVNHQGCSVGILATLKIKHKKLLELLDPNIHVYEGLLKSGYDLNVKKFIRILKIFRKYDILHFHAFSVQLYIVALLSGRPIIHTEHGTFQKANQRKNLASFIKKRILGYFFFKNFTDYLVFNSNWLKENLNIKKKNSIVILNGTDFSNYFPGESSYKIFEKRTIIISVSRLVIRKRIDRIIDVFKNLNSDNFFLGIIGDGPLKDELIKKATLSLDNNSFHFFGYRGDVVEFYKKAKYFILSTQFEPFGLVIIEAVLSGCMPLMFNDAGGALEIIDNIHARLISSNEHEMANNILYWETHTEEYKSICEKLLHHVKSRFSVSRMAEDYMKVYFQVMKKPNMQAQKI